MSWLSKNWRGLRRALHIPHPRDPVALAAEMSAILAEPDMRVRFDRIYMQRLWGRQTKSPRTASGGGSNDAASAAFRADFSAFLRSRHPATLFDAPCGDFYMMRRVEFPPGWGYVGGDIAPSLVRDLRQKFPGRDFLEFDLTRDPFPACDIWLCRACLFHLSFADIRKAMDNFLRSDARTALLTTQRGVEQNRDIVTGDYRPLDLTLPPFNLPRPAQILRDVAQDYHAMIVGIWTREEIAAAL